MCACVARRAGALYSSITMKYKQYMKSPEWAARRRTHLLANPTCFVCGWRGGRLLHVHHNTYVRLGNELPEDLVSLCHDCHDTVHRVVDADDAKLIDAHQYVRCLKDSGIPVHAIAAGTASRGRKEMPHGKLFASVRELQGVVKHALNNADIVGRLGDEWKAWLEEAKKVLAKAPLP